MRLTAAKRSIFTEGAWVAFGQITAALGTLVGIRLLTELLPPDVFGSVVLVTGIAALALALASGPLMQAVLRYYPDYAKSNMAPALRKTVTRLLLHSTFWIGVICFGGWAIYNWIVGSAPWLGVFVVALLAADVARALEVTLFNASRRQRPVALWSAADAWGRPIAALLAVLVAGASVSAVLAGYVAASLLTLVVFLRVVAREGVESTDESIAQNRETTSGQEQPLSLALIHYALPLAPLGLVGWISGQADRYLIAGMIGLDQAGVYAATYGIVSRAFLLAGSTVEQTIRPVYYQAVSDDDSAKSSAILRGWAGLTTAVSAIGVAVFALFHHEISNLLLAEPYRSGSTLMPWIAAGYGLLLISHVFTNVCLAYHDSKAVLITQTAGAVSCLMALAFAVQYFGMAGAAYSVPVFYAIQLALTMLYAGRFSGNGLVARSAPKQAEKGRNW